MTNRTIRALLICIATFLLALVSAQAQTQEQIIQLGVIFPGSTDEHPFTSVVPGASGTVPGYSGNPVPIRFRATNIARGVISCQAAIDRHGSTGWTDITDWVGDTADTNWGIQNVSCRTTIGALMLAVADPVKGWWPVVASGVVTGGTGSSYGITGLAIRYSPTGKFDGIPQCGPVTALLAIKAGCNWSISIGSGGIDGGVKGETITGTTHLFAYSPWCLPPASASVGKTITLKAPDGTKQCPPGSLNGLSWSFSRCSQSSSASCTSTIGAADVSC